MSKSEDAAIAAAASVLSVDDDAAEETPSVDEPPVEDTPSQDAVELPNFEPDVPEDLRAELETEEELDPTFFQRNQVDEEDDDFTAEEDPQVTALKKERDHYKNLRLQDASKRWAEEAKKFFPLSEGVLPQIQADSRRSYLKQAKAAHETVLPFVRDYALKVQGTVEAAREQARAEAKEEARQAWGIPTTEDSDVPTEVEIQAGVEKARTRGDFSDVVKAMLFPKKGGAA